VDQSGTNQGANGAQNTRSDSSEVSQANAEEDEDESLNLDFAPYDPSSLDERQTDDWLQTMSRPAPQKTPRESSKKLRRFVRLPSTPSHTNVHSPPHTSRLLAKVSM